jgi:hypothetical protein
MAICCHQTREIVAPEDAEGSVIPLEVSGLCCPPVATLAAWPPATKEPGSWVKILLTRYSAYAKVKIAMVKTTIFTDKRRELLAKTLMDIAKIAIAAAFASEFFLKFVSWLRAIILLGLVASVGIGFLVCPKGEE